MMRWAKQKCAPYPSVKYAGYDIGLDYLLK
jgi:hypothetical protein